ncbi:MAG: hypothetical protein Q7V04_09675 [Deltaproteobacteria bacterium]|nr:hypothetical protein [Deltaproteobacteria bacterium]
MSYKSCTRRFIAALCIFIALNFLVWNIWTEQLLTDSDGLGGDLARTGYITGIKQPRRAYTDLPRHHIEFQDYHDQPVDVLTIGDSFSNGGGGGKNSFYQDYIATENNMSVLNIGMLSQNQGPLSTLVVLNNSGYLDIIKPKVILLQSAEKTVIERLGRITTFDDTRRIEDIKRFYKEHRENPTYLPPVKFINTGNVKFLYYSLIYRFKDSVNGKVIVRKLSKPLFSTKLDSTLVFWHDDIRNLPKQTPEAVNLLNDNLNRMADLLATKGIKLYFMPAVDKYNLYRDYIIDNPYPESRLFETMRTLPKKYTLIDTKAILAKALSNGKKDIYYADDTHWSWKATELIFNEVRF